MFEPEDLEDYGYQSCPMCSGPAYILGQLGNLEHMRCECCGAVFSKVIPLAS